MYAGKTQSALFEEVWQSEDICEITNSRTTEIL